MLAVYLPPHHHHAPVCRPGQGEGFAAHVQAADARLRADVPQTDGAVSRAAGELRIADGVEDDLLDAGGVTAQVRGVADLRALGVPYSKGAVCRAGRDELAGRVPCYRSDPVE